MAQIGDLVFQAISYEGILSGQEEASRWEMSGMVSGALGELGVLFSRDRRSEAPAAPGGR